MLNKIEKIMLKLKIFFSSSLYWNSRYKNGKNSGPGSYGALANFKSEILNEFVDKHKIETIIEFGCGDGNQLSLSLYPNYIGVDVSQEAIRLCKERFLNDEKKKFIHLSDYKNEKAEVSLSLDVIFHLIEDSTYISYMENLFSSARKYVVIYSSNYHENKIKSAIHVKHRKFTDWIEKEQPEWKLIERINNRYPFNGDVLTTSFCDFYFYEKTNPMKKNA